MGTLPEEEKAFMNTYGINASSNMRQVLNSTRDGLFASSCFLHCHFTLQGPRIRNTNVIDALYSWTKTYMPGETALAKSREDDPLKYKWIDQCAGDAYWPPCNPSCPLIP